MNISRITLFIVSLLAFSISISAAERPNIIVIMCDDLGYADVGFNGSKDIKTPELDRLAEGGTICSSGYSAHPFCGPSRMGFLAGRYPHAIGTPYNLPNTADGFKEADLGGIPVGEILLSKALQDSGYYTGLVGKWHLGVQSEFHPNVRGFEDFYGFLGGGHFYFPEKYKPIYERQLKSGKEPINDYLLPLEHNGQEVEETEYLTDAFSREAARFIEDASQKDQPFFLFLSYNAPHSPLEAKEEDLAMYSHVNDKNRRVYSGMMQAVDRGVGRVVEALKKTGEYEDTLIVFTSDNGGKLSLGANNYPLKHGKGSASEGGFRVPFFFHWPEHVPAGKVFDHPVTSLDLYPTFLGLSGAKLPGGKTLDGLDIMPNLKEGSNPRPGGMIFATRHRGGFSEISGRHDRWKVIRDSKEGPWRLYDLDTDIGETRDVSAYNPERLQELVAEVKEWTETHVEPRWFHSVEEMKSWKKESMPRYEEVFELLQTK